MQATVSPMSIRFDEDGMWVGLSDAGPSACRLRRSRG